jgi:Repeats of unknown function (DUF5649)
MSLGDIAQAPGSALSVAGNATFSAFTGAVTFDNRGNSFGGSVSFSARDATVRDSGPVDLGTTNVTGTLTVHAGGSITESGPVAAAAALFDATGGVLLDTQLNNFGFVSVTSTGSAAVRINTSDDLSLGRFQLGSGVLAIKAGGTTTGKFIYTGLSG